MSTIPPEPPDEQREGNAARELERLHVLYGIARRLARLEALEPTIESVLESIARTLPLTSLSVVVDDGATVQTSTWCTAGTDAERARAEKHVHEVFRFLAGPAAATTFAPTRVRPIRGTAPVSRRGLGRFIALPLSTEARHVFGVLQVEVAAAVGADDLAFVDGIANQLAVFVEVRRARVAERAAREAADRLTERMRDLDALSGAILEGPSLDVMLHRVLGRLREIVGADVAMVLATDDTEPVLHVLASHGLEPAEGMHLPADHGLVGSIVRRRETVVVDDLAASDAVHPVLGRYEMRSLVGVPLMMQGRCTGVLLMGRRAPAAFDGDLVRLLELVADRIGLGIENASLLASERRRNGQLDAIRLATSSVADLVVRSGHDVTAVLHAIADAARLISEADHAAIGLRPGGTQPVDRWVFSGLSGPGAAQSGLGGPSSGFVGSLARGPLPLRMADARAVDVVIGASPPPSDLGPVLAVPIVHEGHEPGVIVLGKRRGQPPFLAADVDTIALFGAQAVVAIETARLVRDLADERGRLAFIVEAGAAMARTLDRGETVDTVVAFAVRGVCEACAVDLVTADGSLVRVARSWSDPSAGPPTPPSEPRHLPRRHPIAHVVRDGRAIVLDALDDDQVRDLMLDPGHDDAVATWRPTSAIVAPLSARGRTFGTMTLLVAAPRTFERGDVWLAEDLATRAALSIDHATLYAEAVGAARAREAITAVVSHDLRNPLTTIRMSTHLLQRSSFVTGADRGHVDVILRAADRMSRLVQDLLDVASIDAGRLSIHLEPTPVARILLEGAGGFVEDAARRGLAFEVSPAPEETIVCDRDRIVQVLANLVANAIKFTPRGGHVRVTTEVDDAEVVFSTIDDGPGIAADLAAHVFDRWSQAIDTAHLGTGLGLSIARGLVEAHGGRIWVESREGRGSTFRFALPRTRRPHADPRASC